MSWLYELSQVYDNTIERNSDTSNNYLWEVEAIAKGKAE